MSGIVLSVDGVPVEVPDGASVAAAVAHRGPVFRRSASGQPRAPLCGMGVCFECRVRIDGVAGLRVVDCSVMPTLVSGNTNVPVVMMAERAAEFVLQDLQAQRRPQAVLQAA